METVSDIQKLLEQGKDPKEVFCYVEDENERNILCVCLHDKMWNFLKVPENKLICSDWYILAFPFNEGFGIVRRNDNEYNFVKQDGSLLSNKWYYYIIEFNDGFAKVKNEYDEWNLLDSNGKEVCQEWYDSIGKFVNGFAKVRKGNWYNFLKKDGTLLCRDWYNLVKDFNNGFVKVITDDGWGYIDITGNIINMEIETLPVGIRQARAWYNTGIEDFEKLSLNFFDKEKLECKDYKGITTYYDALYALGLDETPITMPCCGSFSMDRAASAMFKLMVIQKALNSGKDLHLIKDPEDSEIYYPYNPFVTENSTYYEDELNSDKMEIIGTIKCEGEKYNILGGHAFGSSLAGLDYFDPNDGIGYSRADYSLFGCANEEIAKHFGKYFGMLIIEAMYGRLDGFEVIEDKYGCLE